MIFDTCFIIDLLSGDQKAKNKVLDIESREETLATTALSIFEL